MSAVRRALLEIYAVSICHSEHWNLHAATLWCRGGACGNGAVRNALMTSRINIFVFAELFEQTHARAAGNETEMKLPDEMPSTCGEQSAAVVDPQQFRKCVAMSQIWWRVVIWHSGIIANPSFFFLHICLKHVWVGSIRLFQPSRQEATG